MVRLNPDLKALKRYAKLTKRKRLLIQEVMEHAKRWCQILGMPPNTEINVEYHRRLGSNVKMECDYSRGDYDVYALKVSALALGRSQQHRLVWSTLHEVLHMYLYWYTKSAELGSRGKSWRAMLHSQEERVVTGLEEGFKRLVEEAATTEVKGSFTLEGSRECHHCS
jgi:hypothetical protein